MCCCGPIFNFGCMPTFGWGMPMFGGWGMPMFGPSIFGCCGNLGQSFASGLMYGLGNGLANVANACMFKALC